MTTAIVIEDVRREVSILSSLTGHKNLVQFYDSYEDDENVYIVMELCSGGELLDRILSRGGKYSELDAKVVLIQIISVASFCHLQGVVHRDLKPEVAHTPDLMLAYIDFFLGVLDSAIQWWKDAMTGDDKLRVIMPEAASFKLNHGHEREAFDLYEELVNNNHGDTEALVGAETFLYNNLGTTLQRQIVIDL